MPYLTIQQQQRLKPQIDKILIGTKGELTFLINSLQMQFCEQHFKEVGAHKVDYQLLSDAVSAANDAISEFRRRVMDKYEDHKIRENGDIFRDFIRKANI